VKLSTLQAQPDQPVSHNPAIRKRVLLRTGEVPPLTNAAQAYFAPGQVAGAHAHADMAEVFWVATGSGTIWVDGVAYALEPGTCVAVEPGEQHEIANTGTAELVLFYFGVQV